jgi:hypothetical protein
MEHPLTECLKCSLCYPGVDTATTYKDFTIDLQMIRLHQSIQWFNYSLQMVRMLCSN